jgi:arylsulfatase A-like enzyme
MPDLLGPRRRSAPLLLATLSALYLVTPTARRAVADPPPRRPNIVFILTDDLDAVTMATLPSLKSLLADQGVNFSRFFVSDSLCCPSRASILCGQYDHNHLVLDNGPRNGGYVRFNDLGHEQTTVATWLHDAGYRTVLMGKYLNGYPAGVELTHVPPGWDEWYVPVRGTPYVEYDYSLNENGSVVSYGRQPDDYLVDVLAGKARTFIQAAAASEQPFFMYVAPYAPHFPYTPPPRYGDAFATAAAPRPPSFDEADTSDKPAWLQLLPPLTPKEVSDIDLTFRLRLEAMLAVQDLVRGVVDALAAAGKLDDTYIFFTSDNGYHFGTHRLLPGKQTPYEEDLRVPLVVRGPGVPVGVTRSQLVGNVDFAPTFLELAGAAARNELDGHSMVPLLRQGASAVGSWRTAYLLEHSAIRTGSEHIRHLRLDAGTLEPADPQKLIVPHSALPGVPAFKGLRLRDRVYVEYDTGERELYDLRSDPWELANIAKTADPALLASLSSWLRVMSTCAGPGCRTADEVPAPQ